MQNFFPADASEGQRPQQRLEAGNGGQLLVTLQQRAEFARLRQGERTADLFGQAPGQGQGGQLAQVAPPLVGGVGGDGDGVVVEVVAR